MPSSVIIGSGSCVPKRVIDGSYFMDSTFYTDAGDLIDKPNDEWNAVKQNQNSLKLGACNPGIDRKSTRLNSSH